jgi:hypothetical protein
VKNTSKSKVEINFIFDDYERELKKELTEE